MLQNTSTGKHIISSWDQLRFVPTYKDYQLIVTAYTKPFVGKTVSVVKQEGVSNPTILYTLLVECSFIDNPNIKITSRSDTLNIINSFGFNIEWKNEISLSAKEYDILCSIYKLGYNYLERLENEQQINNHYIVVTKSILNTYDSNFIPKKLESVCNIPLTREDFKWLESYRSLSIANILGIETRPYNYDGIDKRY